MLNSDACPSKRHDYQKHGLGKNLLVLHTAIDAYNLGYQIEVVKPAVASIWPENHQFALGHFKNTLGAKLLDENLDEIKE